MYIEACARLELPFEKARRRLLSVRPDSGRRIHLPLAGLPVGKEVAVEFDSPYDGTDVVSLPVRWKATRPAAAYPSFDGELELTGSSDGPAALWLLGRYRAPLGVIGRTLDRTLLHRLADDSVRAMLDIMASGLERRAA